eukprot:117801-Amphidinium_carterae.1
MVCYEDNKQTISAVRRGYSKKLRHLPRVHKISVGTLHELLDGDQPIGELKYHPTATHKADMFTKCLKPIMFQSALDRITMSSSSRSD